MPDEPPPFVAPANAIANATDTDVILINGTIYRPLDKEVISLCQGRTRRTNVMLILVTEGGDADAAFRIARCLQTSYKRFTLFVTGYCKSAGTLIALGAEELVFLETGELGPLDVQMTKPDELVQTQSGLTLTSALETLNEQAFKAFESFMLSTIGRGGAQISTRTAAIRCCRSSSQG
jgi:membrane-bound ClpP family serine protease